MFRASPPQHSCVVYEIRTRAEVPRQVRLAMITTSGAECADTHHEAPAKHVRRLIGYAPPPMTECQVSKFDGSTPLGVGNSGYRYLGRTPSRAAKRQLANWLKSKPGSCLSLNLPYRSERYYGVRVILPDNSHVVQKECRIGSCRRYQTGTRVRCLISPCSLVMI